jgi:putative salt-induced outer membrane protein YdiY
MALGRALAALLLMMVFSLHSARADQIVLANGDRLTGKVVSKTEDTLKFRTEYAGEIKVRWKNVVSITTDEPVTVMSANGELRKERLEYAKTGSVKLISEGASREMPLAELAHINPPPHVSGTGVSYTGRIDVLASASRGNTDDERLFVQGRLTARAKSYRYSINARAERKDESGVRTASNGLLAANYDRFLDTDRFAYVRTSLENDEFKDIRVKATLGGGLGWQIFDTKEIELALRGGLDYVVLDRQDGDPKNYPALGWGINYSHWLWPDHLQLFHDQQGFMNLNDASDITLRTITGVRLPIGSGLSANAQLNLDYEGDAGPGTDKTDAQVLLGLGYDF